MCLNPTDYGRAAETQLSPSEKYRAESFLPVIEQFTASLGQRLQAYRQISSQSAFFGRLSELSPEQLQAAGKKLVKSY